MISMKLVVTERGESSPLSVKRLQAAWIEFLIVLEQMVIPEMVFP